MGFIDAVKRDFARDPVVRLGKRLFSKRSMTEQDEAAWHYKQARPYLNLRSGRSDLSSAIYHLRQAVKLAPKNATYRCALGQAFLLAPPYALISGDAGGLDLSRCINLAVKQFEKCVRDDPGSGWAYYCMALGYDYLGYREKAREQCRAGLKASATGDTAKLTESYLKSLESPGADRHTVAKLRQESLNHLRQAMAYQKARKRGPAVKEFEEGCKLAPDSSWLYQTLCRLAAGQPEGTD